MGADSSSGCAVMYRMRVVTAALSMASTVSAKPGPVPGAGGNCAAPRGANNGVLKNARSKTKADTKRFTKSPSHNFSSHSFGRRHRFSEYKGPLPQFAGAHQESQSTQRNLDQSPLASRPRVPKQRRPAHHGQHRRQRVQPHFERKPLRRPTPVQQDYAHSLPDELHQEAHGQN